MGDFQRKLKEGEILRYKSGFLGKKWKECWAVLYSDSELVWYDKKGDSKPSGSVFLKDVVPYTCVGPMCDRMPVRRPELPQRYSLYHLVGIGMDAQASKVHWLLFSSDSDLESWFTEIMKTLPKPNPPPPPPANNAQQLPTAGPNVPPPTYNPPPVYPSSPPQMTNTYPSQPVYNPATNPAAQPPIYPSTVPNYGGGAGGTTVIIDRNGGGYGPRYGGGGGGGGGGGSSGPGLGTGMLMGSLLGFGLGSMWGGGLHSGFGFGGHCYPSHLGMGSGFGGGYVQDNDTYITNNYYVGDSGNRDAIGEHNTESSTVVDTTNSANNQDTMQDYYGGYDVSGGNRDNYDGDGGGYDIGDDYDDSGGYDIGGDDFGGGDFDGGDFGGGDW
uniref:Bm3912 n=1 Tax=Brugia malayi TaxID=6279 RepID=A0A0H5RZX8_BRUMA|nr:Bm3912 [Brugia malayi]